MNKKKVLLIEDDKIWEGKIREIFNKGGYTITKVLNKYTEAENELKKADIFKLSGIIVDMRIRDKPFDQGGLSLLDIAKKRRPNIPALILTAYSDDYPGLEKIVSRYRKTISYDKEVLLDSPKVVIDKMDELLKKYKKDEKSETSFENQQDIDIDSEQVRKFKPLLIGFLCIILIIVSGIGSFLLLERFSNFQKQGNVIFALVVVCLFSVLISVFGRKTVEFAFKFTKNWLKGLFGGRKE